MHPKAKPIYKLSARNPLTYKDTPRVKVSGWRKLHNTDINQKKTGVAMSISDGANFKQGKLPDIKKDAT